MKKFIHFICAFGLVFAGILLYGCGKKRNYSEVVDLDSDFVSESESVTEDIQDYYVYVCGQVLKPGVYVLPSGSRICEAVECAGGMTADAAMDYLNLAQLLEDGMKVYIPTVEEAESGAVFVDEGPTSSEEGKININTADKEELMSLPSIGNTRAESIIKYREKNGYFSSIEEIMNVSGIKEASYEMIEEYITVN